MTEIGDSSGRRKMQVTLEERTILDTECREES